MNNTDNTPPNPHFDIKINILGQVGSGKTTLACIIANILTKKALT